MEFFAYVLVVVKSFPSASDVVTNFSRSYKLGLHTYNLVMIFIFFTIINNTSQANAFPNYPSSRLKIISHKQPFPWKTMHKNAIKTNQLNTNLHVIHSKQK